jgi:hypothetical protein
LADGTLRISYTRAPDSYLVERVIDRYQSLSYPQSGYVAGRGWWTKFADGTLIQRALTPGTVTNNPVGNIYFSGWLCLFPVNFIDIDYDIGFYAYGIGYTGIWAGGVNALKTVSGITSMYIYGPTNGANGQIGYVAIGRWKP